MTFMTDLVALSTVFHIVLLSFTPFHLVPYLSSQDSLLFASLSGLQDQMILFGILFLDLGFSDHSLSLELAFGLFLSEVLYFSA